MSILIGYSLSPAYLVAVIDGYKESSPAIFATVLYATFLAYLVYTIAVDYAWLYRRFHSSILSKDPVKSPKEVTSQDDQVAVDRAAVDGIRWRGDKQPPTTSNSLAMRQSYSVKSFDDGSHLNENTFTTSGYYTATSNYSDYSYKSKIVGGGNVKVPLTRSMLQGTESVADKGYDVHRHTVKASQAEASDHQNPSFREAPHTSFNFSESSGLKTKYPPNNKISRNEGSFAYTIAQKDLELPALHRESKTQNTGNEIAKRQAETGNESVKPSQEKASSTYALPEPKKGGYNKSTYAVLIGNTVKVYSTNTFASFPHNNKFLVKERHQDASGITKVKLTLKSTEKERYISYSIHFYAITNNRSLNLACMQVCLYG